MTDSLTCLAAVCGQPSSVPLAVLGGGFVCWWAVIAYRFVREEILGRD